MALLRRRRSRAPRDPLWSGLLAVLAMAAITVAVVGSWNPFAGDRGHVYEATFGAARQVNGDTPVRVDGVTVGRVEDVRYDAARRSAKVRFRITDEDVVLRRDVELALRWRTALGGRMELAVDPGSRSAPPLAGREIPRSRTRIQTELEDVARVVRGDARRGLRTTLRELPDALGGQDAGRALDALGRLRDVAPAARALRGEQRDDLPGLVRSTGRALSATAASERQLQALVADGERTLRAIGARRGELRATLATAPAAMAETRRLTANVDATLPVLDATVEDLRPGARQLAPVLARATPTLRRLARTLRRARPLLTSLDGALPSLASAAGQGSEMLAALRPTSERLQRDLVPFLEREDEALHLPVYQMIGPTFATVGAMSGLIGEHAHVVNFPITLGERSQMLLPCTTYFADPSASDQLIECRDLDQALQMLLGAWQPGTDARRGGGGR